MNELGERDVFRSADLFQFSDFGIVFGCDFRSEMEFRIRGAIELVRREQIGALILSGGMTGTSGRTEEEGMEAMALDAGISSARLLLEETSRTTQQNVLECANIIRSRHDHSQPCSVALITSDWHMSRAWMMAKAHLPPGTTIFCAPQKTTCNAEVWSETVQCACLIRSELRLVKFAMQRGYPDPRRSNEPRIDAS
ncbi:YdcF family protein [Stieleria sp. ICT_E10.1]|uniref:YdcF family protein n=1 Tax=Stieleria sedimenti TaxID=2976331 RepID=UPI00217F5D79|nr:YdcF family protein [Stieleria sedimenti]MCS7466145.1 YdcF family protein [Stieleria sedimenti]